MALSRWARLAPPSRSSIVYDVHASHSLCISHVSQVGAARSAVKKLNRLDGVTAELREVAGLPHAFPPDDEIASSPYVHVLSACIRPLPYIGRRPPARLPAGRRDRSPLRLVRREIDAARRGDASTTTTSASTSPSASTGPRTSTSPRTRTSITTTTTTTTTGSGVGTYPGEGDAAE